MARLRPADPALEPRREHSRPVPGAGAPMISVAACARRVADQDRRTEIMGAVCQPTVPFTCTMLNVPPNAVMPAPPSPLFRAWAKKYSACP